MSTDSSYLALQRRLPRWLRRHVMHFDTTIEEAVATWASALPRGQMIVDAGAGEARHRSLFDGSRYVAVDLAVGDATWDYRHLDAIADLTALPLRTGSFDAALNVVTLEHLPHPDRALAELARVLRPGAALLVVAPSQWEEHQAPHDYFRYTRYGLEHLLGEAGFTDLRIEPVGGFFRLLQRRLLNSLQFFPGPTMYLAALVVVPLALVAPLFDRLDSRRHFTLGYVCRARRG